MTSQKRTIKVGYCLSLTGPLAANGQTARLAHQIWQDRVNEEGGLIGFDVELICLDDASDGSMVAGIYQELLDDKSVDLLIGGYGNNSISPAMPIAIDHGKFFVGLMGLGVNIAFSYDRYFAMIPTGTEPNTALTEGFFETASRQVPTPRTVAIVAADAPFTKNPIEGARSNAAKHGLEVVSETRYSLDTNDFTAILRQTAESGADIFFLCSYLNDSVGLIRDLAQSDLDPLVVGGAMIGPQSSAVQTQLGPLLNGIVNYEYWLPIEAMSFPGVHELISTFQSRARGTTADALGYYVAPLAYSQLQVLEQAIKETGSIDDAELAEYAHSARFRTVMGDIRFGELGEWAKPRVLTVQFRDVESPEVSEFAKAGARVAVAPNEYSSGELVIPYRASRSR